MKELSRSTLLAGDSIASRAPAPSSLCWGNVGWGQKGGPSLHFRELWGLGEQWEDRIEECPGSWEVLNDFLLGSPLCLTHVHV